MTAPDPASSGYAATESKRDAQARKRHAGRAAAHARVLEAREELASTLDALEDKLNFSKRINTFIAERPAAAAVAGIVVAGVVVAVTVAIARSNSRRGR